ESPWPGCRLSVSGSLPLAGRSLGARDRRLDSHVLRIGPVVVLFPAPPRKPPHVGAIVVRALELLVGDVAVLVPVVVLLGDAEVDERTAPEVSKAHGARNRISRGGFFPIVTTRGRCRRGSASRPPRLRPGSPDSSPSTARAGRAPRPA